MDDRLSRVESSLRELRASVAALETRVAAQERQMAAVALGHEPQSIESAPSESITAADALPQPAHERPSPIVPLLSAAGRTFVVFGGAFLLRALSDSSVVPVNGGIALGLAYAAVWMVAGDRAAASRRILSASFHVAAGCGIAFPIVVEAATRFSVLGPWAAAAALGIVAAAGLGIGVARRVQPLAWIALIPALAAIMALVVATGAVVPFALVALLLGIWTLWIGYTLDWTVPRWPVAIVADLLIAALPARAAAGTAMETTAAVLAIQMALVGGYLASIAIRTIVRRRDVNLFEIVQATTTLGVGFGGALYVVRGTTGGTATVAVASLLIGTACYAVAFAFVARQQGLRRNFYFYTSFGLTLVLAANAVLLPEAARAIVWSALAIATSVVARGARRQSLELHSTAYTVAAAAAGGLLASATSAMLLPPGQWPGVSWLTLAVLPVTVAVWLIQSRNGASAGTAARVAGVTLVVVVCWSASGLVVQSLAAALGRGGPVSAGIIATIRTATLGGASVALAWLGRTERYRAARWLVYPLVVGTGVKLLAEDIPRSKPSALFVALAVYGLVLIAAPRLGQQHTPAR